MKMIIRIVVLILLTLAPAASGARENARVGFICGETAQTAEGFYLDLPGTRFAVEEGSSVLVKTVRP